MWHTLLFVQAYTYVHTYIRTTWHIYIYIWRETERDTQETQRERDTHTHTHTERETERLGYIPGSIPLHVLTILHLASWKYTISIVIGVYGRQFVSHDIYHHGGGYTPPWYCLHHVVCQRIPTTPGEVNLNPHTHMLHVNPRRCEPERLCGQDDVDRKCGLCGQSLWTMWTHSMSALPRAPGCVETYIISMSFL